MNKIVLIEAKCGVGAEQIGKALADEWSIPFVIGNATITGPCVALNWESSDLPDEFPTAKIYLYADFPFREALFAYENGMDETQAQLIISETDASCREKYLARNLHEIGLTEDYVLCINTAFCNITKSTKIAHEYVMYRILQDCLSEVDD